MASPEGLAALFVDGMDQDVQEEFAQIAAKAKVYRPGHLKVAEGMIKSHVDMLFTSRGKATWQVQAQPRPAPEKLILSENNKEHLKVIAAALTVLDSRSSSSRGTRKILQQGGRARFLFSGQRPSYPRPISHRRRTEPSVTFWWTWDFARCYRCGRISTKLERKLKSARTRTCN